MIPVVATELLRLRVPSDAAKIFKILFACAISA